MNRKRPALRLRIAVAATLCALALAACAGDSAGPPAPPPQPQTVAVTLGDHGGSITLTRQGNSYTRNGQAFGSGDTVEGTNGQTYRLTLSGGQWTAAYVAPDPWAVALGTSGDAVLVTRQEDGTYSVGGETVESGGLVTADSGNQYRLTLHRTVDGNEWRAAYVAPDPVSVQLGASGGTLAVRRNEDGTFTADGRALASGDTRTGTNDSDYRLTLRGGEWSAAYVAPRPETINLGTYGGRVTVTRNEDGSFNAGSTTFSSGDTVTAANGNEYTLTLRGGNWRAAYVAPTPDTIDLGTHGGRVTVTRNEDGSFNAGSTTFSSGDTVTAANGNEYTLTLRGGSWRAAYVAPTPDTIDLGTHGGRVTVTRNEDGSFSAGSTTFSSGDTVTAANGNEYTLTLRGGNWTAAYVQPPAVRVTLGTSIYSVSLRREENGTYRLNGQPFTSGSTWTASNGSVYVLTVNRNGQWTSAFVPTAADIVVLGSSGTSVRVVRREDGKYEAGGELLTSGARRVASNGNEYQLDFANGRWVATYVPTQVSVALGTSGRTVILERQENGSYFQGAREVTNRFEYELSAGRRYRLTRQGDQWSAQFIPVVLQVEAGESGTTLSIQRVEDGSYLLDGSTIESGDTVRRGDNEYLLTLRNGQWTARFQSGTISVDLPNGGSADLEKREDGSYVLNGRVVRSGGSYRIDGVLYTLRRSASGVWVATRWIPSTGGSGSTTPDPGPDPITDEIGTNLMGTSVAFDLRSEGTDVAGTEGTHLTVGPSDNQRQYAMGELLDEGIVRRESTHVEVAREAIQSAANSIRLRGDLFRLDLDILRDTSTGLPGLWSDAQDAFGRIPGFDGTDLRAPWGTNSSRASSGHIEDAADDLEDVVDALSSEGAFVDAYGTRNRAAFAQRSASLVFGSQGQTRFGAFANHNADDQSAPWDYGNFAYSPLNAPTAGSLRTQGRATYTGDTVAVHAPDATTEPTLYDGDIGLTVTFSTGLVTGRITNLDDEDGDEYRYGGRDVSAIELPAATMNSTGAFSISSGGMASLTPGPSLNQVDSEWQGQLVNGDSEAFGVWKVDADAGGELLGSFGAGRNSRQSSPTSFEDSSGTSIRTSVFSKSTPISAVSSSGSTMNLRSTVTISSSPTNLTTAFANLNLRSGSTLTRNVQNGATDIGDAWLGATSATRFGAWIVPTSTGVTQAYEAFAYSPFSATPPSVISALHFTGIYKGQTRAVVLESSQLSVFTGQVQVDITWDRGASTNDSLRVRLYDFSRVQGSSDALIAANLHFTKSETLGNTFADATLDSTNSSHANLSGTPVGASTRAHGSLVGSTIDGPRGVIGTWTLNVSSAEAIEGAYGADLAP